MPIFRIANQPIEISFSDSPYNSMRLIPSFAHFIDSDNNNSELLFRITVDDNTKPIKKAERERIRDFDTGNGITSVDRTKAGCYQFIVRNIKGNECCLLITNQDFSYFQCALNGDYNMRSFGLNNALMLAYAFAGASAQTLLIHASLVRQNGIGYAFIAKSGTGKSTQVSNWLRYLPGCDLMNDDNPVVRLINGKAYVYGSPWSGKTPCYRNVSAPLGAITRIDRAKENSIEKLSPVDAFASILPAVSSMKWEERLYEKTCDTVSKIIATTNIYTLHCLPDRESAEICNKAIRNQ